MVEFTVPGTPRSLQAESSSKRQWQQKVKAYAPFQPKLLTGPLRVRITFFFDGAAYVDTDNIIKPIQDALEGEIYENDRIVVDVCARKVDVRKMPSIKPLPPAVSSALGQDLGDFVYVLVADAKKRLAFK